MHGAEGDGPQAVVHRRQATVEFIMALFNLRMGFWMINPAYVRCLDTLTDECALPVGGMRRTPCVMLACADAGGAGGRVHMRRGLHG